MSTGVGVGVGFLGSFVGTLPPPASAIAALIGTYGGFDFDMADGVVTSATDIDSVAAQTGSGTFGPLVQSVAAQKPHLLSSEAQFDGLGFGAGDYLKSGDAASVYTPLHLAAGSTLVAVARYESDGSGVGTIMDTCSQSASQIGVSLVVTHSSGTTQGIVSDGGGSYIVRAIKSSGVPVAGQDNIFTFVWDGATGSLRINGGAETSAALSGSPSASAPQGSLAVGATNVGTSLFLKGAVKRSMAFIEPLDDTELNSVIAELGTEYGITVATI